MLGRVRASPMGSLELLEMERPNSKIIKHDSLSIYESTLMKLKQGSHCNPRCNPEDSARADPYSTIMTTSSPEEAVTSDADCCSTDSFPNSTPCFQSTGPLKAQGNRNMSILYYFSKYKSSPHAQSSNDKEEMAIESGYYSSSSGSNMSSC
ncbi:hypothetical protein Salat_0022800 [Sesamum alatum]|uniref:Uncharacterized protein n=1 Tax=Sesamum alatum TaxID=300844 RepID=A0AAE1YUU8_9LAMI|nr:hypothetical protein Salat_0022800 [Sesamum alatum]